MVELGGRRRDDGPWLVDSGLAVLLPTRMQHQTRAKTVLAVVTRRQGGFCLNISYFNVLMILRDWLEFQCLFFSLLVCPVLGEQYADNGCELVQKLRIGQGQSQACHNSQVELTQDGLETFKVTTQSCLQSMDSLSPTRLIVRSRALNIHPMAHHGGRHSPNRWLLLTTTDRVLLLLVTAGGLRNS